ncbi:conserved Plasmodium protein, unknown function [Plasmodium sp. DRC-Itaito]|uniref:Uncharacterized protein n=2 Tax=Plasmodium gaboni TaxID=647221 RepID=A0ABY1UMU2_9APIC|nr:conserved Plasmodium protein, unknown function [Plasmodium gaboni]SOV22653.1 conserved Plasmodium protein, unknown function [Plasmodium sp. DRC-Itaito]
MEEKGKCKKIMESPYSIELEPLDHEKSSTILKTLLEIISSNISLEFLIFTHDEIVQLLEDQQLDALILIRTVQYEKYYKHIPIIAALKKISFVLLEENYFDTIEFNSIPYKNYIGIKKRDKENNTSSSSIYERMDYLISLINSYHNPINIPYLFNDPHYINTKFKVEKISTKPYNRNLSRKEKKKIRKSLKKDNKKI